MVMVMVEVETPPPPCPSLPLLACGVVKRLHVAHECGPLFAHHRLKCRPVPFGGGLHPDVHEVGLGGVLAPLRLEVVVRRCWVVVVAVAMLVHCLLLCTLLHPAEPPPYTLAPSFLSSLTLR